MRGKVRVSGDTAKRFSLSPVSGTKPAGKRRSGLSLGALFESGDEFTVRLDSTSCLEKSSPQPPITIPFAAKSTTAP